MVQKVFITFGAGNNDYVNAVNRIVYQAKNLNVFDKVIGYGVKDLQSDEEFWANHSKFILAHKKGFGYWLWKPYLLCKTLNELNDGDVVLYCDAGCELDVRKAFKMNEYFSIVEKDLLLGDLTCDEKVWTKKDLILYLDVDKPEYLLCKQRRGGTIMVKKCEETMKLLSEWFAVATADNYHYLDDSKSIAKNYPCFKQHRHDQSIFSLLTKKHRLFSQHLLKEPICIVRNRTGKMNF